MTYFSYRRQQALSSKFLLTSILILRWLLFLLTLDCIHRLCVGLTDRTRVWAHTKIEMVLIKITGRPGLEPVTHARKRRSNWLSLLRFPDILRYGVCWNVQLSTFLIFFDLDRRLFESAEVLTRSSQPSGPNFRTPQGQPFAETRK